MTLLGQINRILLPTTPSYSEYIRELCVESEIWIVQLCQLHQDWRGEGNGGAHQQGEEGSGEDRVYHTPEPHRDLDGCSSSSHALHFQLISLLDGGITDFHFIL